MRVLVVGATGLVGSHCLAHFAAQPGWQVVGTRRHNQPKAGTPPPAPIVELDLAQAEALAQAQPAIERGLGGPPQWVAHCAALTHVDLCQDQPALSHLHNVVATRRLASWAHALGARLAYLSSDYVFDGRQGPYAEADPTGPLNVYGHHKLQAEREVLNTDPMALVVRITNVYGVEEPPRNFVWRLAHQIAQATATGQPLRLRLPTDQWATPIWAHDVARALALLMAQQPQATGLWHLAGQAYVSRTQLAQIVASHFGPPHPDHAPPNQAITIEGVATAMLGQRAPRPLWGGLRAAKFGAAHPSFEFALPEAFLRQHAPKPFAQP